MRAALYARVSTEDQREASIDDQLRKCAELCRRESLDVAGKFSDFGISGNEVNRPGYQSLLTAARAGEFDVIVADEASRLWRNEGEQAQRVEELQFLGRHVLTGDGIDTRREGFEVLLAVKGALSKLEIRRIAARVHRTLEGLARQGKSAGGRAFGYKPVPLYDGSRTDAYGRPIVIGARREVVLEQAAIVREIFELYSAGWSARRIANELNARCVPSPGASWQRKARRTDGKWLASTIAGDPKRGIGILNNELYVGRYVWNRSAGKKRPGSAKRAQFQRPKSDHVVIEAPELRIVPQELWDRAKARQRGQSERVGERVKRGLTLSAATRTGRGPKYLFSGLLRCGECGANFTVTGHKQYYVCASFTNGGKHGCGNKLRVPRAIVEDRLLEAIKRDLLAPEYVSEFQKEARRVLRERGAAGETQRAAHAARSAKLRQEVANIVDAIASGTLRASPALSERLSRAESELTALERSQGADRDAAAKLVEVLPRAVERYRKLVGDLGNALVRDVARARAELKAILGGAVTLRPADCGTHLEAELSLDGGSVLDEDSGRRSGRNIRMVAGVGFEPTTFGL